VRYGRLGLIASVLATSVASAASCSSFDEESGGTPDAGAGAPDGAAADASGGGDGATTDEDGSVVDGSLDDTSVTLASGLTGLVSLAVTNNDAFVARSDGSILKLPLTGGDGGTMLLLDKLDGLSSIAIAGNFVVYSTSMAIIGRVGTAGGSLSSSNVGLLRAFVGADTMSVFSLRTNGATHEVRRYDINLSPSDGYANLPLPPDDLALVGDKLFWTSSTAGIVYAGDTKNAAPPRAWTTAELGCGPVAADAFGVYWATPAGVRARVMDAGTSTLAPDRTAAIAAADGDVYWLVRDAPGFLRSKRNGKTVQTLASGFALNFAPGQKAIALTPQYVVWITTDGRIMRHDR